MTRFGKRLEEGGESLVCWRIDSTQKKDREFKETHKRWIFETSWQVHRSECSYQAITCDRQGLWMSTAAPRPPSVLPLSWLQTFRSPVHSINRLDHLKGTLWNVLLFPPMSSSDPSHFPARQDISFHCHTFKTLFKRSKPPSKLQSVRLATWLSPLDV